MTEPQTGTPAQKAIRPRDRDAILQSLRAGVVPRRGQQFIQVGRSEEVRALLQDLDRIADGGSAIRFVIGEFGSGKTFFLFLIRSIALEKGLVTAHADLTPDRRLQAIGRAGPVALHRADGEPRDAHQAGRRRGGQRRRAVRHLRAAGGPREGDRGGRDPPGPAGQPLGDDRRLRLRRGGRRLLAGARPGQRSAQIRRGALAARRVLTRTDARKALGVRTIVDDDNIYDQLKLFSRFTRLAGYGGLLVCLDELVNLYKLANTQARSGNYEQILRILNDSLQGTSAGLGFLLGGTPEFLLDTRRGLYSYEALRSRLAQNRFADRGADDFTGRCSTWRT